MAINFPTSLDSISNPTSTSNVSAVDHALQHSNANDAIEAIETKIGIDGSADTNSLDYKVSQRVVGQSSSVDNEIALFSGTGGKTIKRATTTGLLKATSGVIAQAVAGTDYTSPSSTESPTNKTFNANGTGNSITNLEVADFASGVIDTDLSSVSGSDDTLPSAKATKTYADTKKADSMSTNKLLGRGTAGTGAIEEITLGTGLSLSGTTINATASSSAIGCVAYLSSAQTLSNNTITAITFNAETFDTSTFHDNVTNNSRFTVPSTGKYVVNAGLAYDANSTGNRRIYIRIDGSTTYRELEDSTISGTRAHMIQVGGLLSLTSGQYIEILGYQSSGGNLDVQGDSTRSYCEIHRIGD